MTACLAALGLAPIPASARLAPMEVRAQAQQTGAISGNVVDQADSPVADVVVTTTDASGNIYTAATDADGAFTLPDLPAPASYVLTFTPPAGYGGATFTTGVSPGETFSIGYITVQAQPGAVVGVVTDQDGVPLDGMQVQVSSFVTTTTDSDGGYALAGLLPGSYPLTVIDGNDALAEGTVSIAGDTVTVNVTLPRPAVPAGTTARDAARDLGYLNAERAALGLPAGIVENTRWSTECAAHDHYLSENHLLQHPENLSQRIRGSLRRRAMAVGPQSLGERTHPPEPAVLAQPQRDRHRREPRLRLRDHVARDAAPGGDHGHDLHLPRQPISGGARERRCE